MLNLNYVTGNRERIFINTSFGCNSYCSYCYLPSLGIKVGKRPQNAISPSNIIDNIAKNTEFVPGRLGTIISIGCYSECWDSQNKKSTKSLIEHFLSTGNPVQIATKRFIHWKEFQYFSEIIQWKGQLIYFISCPTISQWKKYEKGTLNPEKRFESFLVTEKTGILGCLYIKPVIELVTIQDCEIFAQIILKYSVPAIVGSMFVLENTTQNAPIGRGNLFYKQHTDEKRVISYLKNFGEIYNYSVELTNKWRFND